MTDLFVRFSEDLQLRGLFKKDDRYVYPSCKTTYKSLLKITRKNVQ